MFGPFVWGEWPDGVSIRAVQPGDPLDGAGI